MNDMARIEDFSVKIDGESYSMIEIPDAASALVRRERDRTLKSIKLDRLLKNLSLTGDLINLAYNATPSKFGDLRSSIGKLHDGFGQICTKCERQMDELEEATASILPNLKRVFKFLVEGKEDLAVKFLQRCTEQATKLSKGMTDLANEFDRLGNDAVTALGGAETLRGIEKQKIEELKEKAAELEAKTANAEKLAELLAEAKKSLEQKYNEAKEKAESAENRAFALSMVSAILQPIGEGLGAVAGAYARSSTPGMLPMPTPAPPARGTHPVTPPAGDPAQGKSPEQLQVEKEAAQRKLADLEAQMQAARQAVTDAQAEVTQATEAMTAAEAKLKAMAEDAPEKAEADQALVDAKAKQAAAEEKLKIKQDLLKVAEAALAKAKDGASALEAAYQRIGSAVSQAGQSVGQAGDSYFSLADEYRKEKSRYLELLLQKEEQERQALASIKEYAVRMKNIGEQEQTAAVTASALFQAVGALKQVVVILREAARFWTNMAAACDRLADDKIRKDIADFSDLDLEDRLELYREEDFKRQVVCYFAGWKALEVIAQEYAKETGTIRDRVYADYENYLDDEQAKALAARLGGKLLDSTEADLSAKETFRREIEVAQQQTEQEARAA